YLHRLHFSTTDRAILKNVLIVTPLSIMGRGGTLLIYSVLANWFGVNRGMDFLYYHWGVASFFIEILSAASAYSVLIPMLAAERAKSHAAANACLGAIFSLYLLGMPPLCLVLAALSYLLSLFFLPASGLPANVIFGIVGGLAIFAIFASLRWLLKAVLDAYQHFNLPAIMQGLRVPVVIGLIYFLKGSLGIYSIVLALTIGELFQAMVLFIACRFSLAFSGLFDVKKVRHHWQAGVHAKPFFKQCGVMMGAAVADGLNPVVDRGMAGMLGAGSVSKLDYAIKLCAIPESMAGVIFPVLLSHWSAVSADDDIQRLRGSVWKGVLVTVGTMGPLLFGFYLFRSALVGLLYGHGVMAEAELHHVSVLLGIYLIGTLARLVSRLLIRAHLALQNINFIFSATLIRTVLNPFLNLVFMWFWGLDGIALSTALLSIPLTAYIGIAFWIVSRRKDVQRDASCVKRET
ncbi:hypothetical protein HYR99_25560, partial [Candidatus Poribacteria bacterium]|nr:hypothetical protein [Candidatus Poribacteria bacterium]